MTNFQNHFMSRLPPAPLFCTVRLVARCTSTHTAQCVLYAAFCVRRMELAGWSLGFLEGSYGTLQYHPKWQKLKNFLPASSPQSHHAREFYILFGHTPHLSAYGCFSYNFNSTYTINTELNYVTHVYVKTIRRIHEIIRHKSNMYYPTDTVRI